MVNLSTYHPDMFRDQRPFPQGVLLDNWTTRDAPALYKTSANVHPSPHGERIKCMETSKSTLTVAQEALKAGQESLPDYGETGDAPQLSIVPFYYRLIVNGNEYAVPRFPLSILLWQAGNEQDGCESLRGEEETRCVL
jgi:hypothetical protein